MQRAYYSKWIRQNQCDPEVLVVMNWKSQKHLFDQKAHGAVSLSAFLLADSVHLAEFILMTTSSRDWRLGYGSIESNRLVSGRVACRRWLSISHHRTPLWTLPSDQLAIASVPEWCHCDFTLIFHRVSLQIFDCAKMANFKVLTQSFSPIIMQHIAFCWQVNLIFNHKHYICSFACCLVSVIIKVLLIVPTVLIL